MLLRLAGGILAMLVLTAPASAAPPFADRGIIEGAYGRPWTPAERMAMLEWMAPRGLNAYVHAPKDDLWGRTCWRGPYPADQQAAFDAEIRRARALGVEWIPNISPAVPLIPTAAAPTCTPSRDLCFSCPADIEAVHAKLAPFVAAGTRTVMISFDDVSKVLTHPEDLARYGAMDPSEGFGRANGDFLTALQAAYAKAGERLRILTVGADYSGTADTPYLRGLRATLDPAIDVMWTGTDVPSEDWTRDDAGAYAKAIGRRPLVWDNWTNTDTAGSIFGEGTTSRIFLGPYKRRDGIAGSVGGFYLNAANAAHLNKLPLATAADWMQDPSRYDPLASWLAAVRSLAGTERAENLRAWAETSWSNKLDRELEAPAFTRRARALIDAYRAGADWPGPFEDLRGELGLVRAAPAALPAMRDRDFAAQAQAFLLAAARGAEAGDLGARLLAAERPELAISAQPGGGFALRARPPRPAEADALRSELDDARTRFTADPQFTYGWRTPYAFEIPPYPVPRNVMLAFLDEVEAHDGEFQQRAQQAAGGIELTIDGAPVALVDGAATLPAGACGGLLVARDPSGGATARRLAPCAPPCLPSRATLNRRGLGAVPGARLGARAPKPKVRSVCGGGRVAVLTRRGRVVAVATSARGHRAAAGLRPGAKAPRRGRPGIVALVRRGRIRALSVGRSGVSRRTLLTLARRTA